MQRCYSCFREIEDGITACPYCQEIVNEQPKEAIYLSPGTVLAGRYMLGHCVGAGGFGIIYKAWDQKHETVVAVKEFFASRLVTRAAGTKEVIINKKSQEEFQYRKTRFLAEARNMAMFGAHKSIPNVFEFFEENNTAYIVMELLNGQALNDYLRSNGGKLDVDFAVMITNEIGNALTSMHKKGILHRDVAPDNIYINSDKNLSIKLLDLGAAKLTDTDDDVIDIILKPGYSPVEQYDNTGAIGPWTDVYALGASLYVMLTGVKPPESTNRKIDDTLVAPHVLDSEIPEQLSLTVMKAMALDKHMRFKTVSDFLKALNGQKKVVTIEKEKRRRRAGRFAGVLCALLAVALVSISALNIYEHKKTAELLNPAEISIWFCQEDGSTEEQALQAVIDDFRQAYPDIAITLRAIPESEYSDTLQDAADNNTLPTLFESDGVDEAILQMCTDITPVLESEQASECMLLESYSGTKQLPLAFQIPMAYVITNGTAALDYTENYFTQLSDFVTDAGISLDPAYAQLVAKNFTYEEFRDSADFMNSSENSCAVMLSSSMAFNTVHEQLPGYEKTYVFPNLEKLNCEYVYFWSVGNGDDDQTEAAMRLLTWMLGNNYQNMLMISYCNDGQLPLNEECFAGKATQKYWEPLKEISDSFVIEYDNDVAEGLVISQSLEANTQAAVDTETALVVSLGRRSVPEVLSAGLAQTVGLRVDGTVIAAGSNVDGKCDVSGWTDIVSVSAGEHHTVGLKADGTMVAVGLNDYGQCDVSSWTDIVAISAGINHTVALREDGTVVATGANEYGQCDVSSWADIVAISAEEYHTVGLRSDGTVVAAGWDKLDRCDVSGWTDIVAISTGYIRTVGLRADGTMVAVGLNDRGQCDVIDWTDIVAISAGTYHTVALREDGSVVATGANEYGQCDVSSWADIVAISAGNYHTVGLRSDGTVVAVGWNVQNQCDVSGWTEIMLPEDTWR